MIKGLKAAFRVLENLDGAILKDGNKEIVENRVSYQDKVRGTLYRGIPYR